VTYKTPARLSRLLAQGTWIEGEIDGQRIPYLAMPTTELRDELDEALESTIKRQLNKSGWERVCATERRHPFHSDVLRERMDALAQLVFVRGRHAGEALKFDPRLATEELAEKERRSLKRYAAETKSDTIPFTKRDADIIVDRAIQDNKVCWSAAVGKYRSYLSDPAFWKGTYVGRTLFPAGQPEIPDGPLPKPVYLSRSVPDMVIALANGFVNLWVRSRQSA
jgi:hypothetical protein